jgi:excisionase family DNA binding protein
MAVTPIRLTISQASNLFGISQKTIRRAIADQEIHYIVVRGVYKINFESMLKWSQERIKISNKLAKVGIGQYVDKWKIKNRLYSPNPKLAETEEGAPAKKRGRPKKVQALKENGTTTEKMDNTEETGTEQVENGNQENNE